MGRRPTLAGALTAPLLLFALAACGSNTSVADPPVSAPPTSPSSTAPPQHETPEHFIRRFYAAENRLENTGETRAYGTLIKGCLPCDSLVKDVKRFYAAGGYIKWGGLKVLSIVNRGRQHGGAIGYAITGDASETRFRKTAAELPQSIQGGITSELLSLKKTSRAFVVVARSRLPR